MRILIGLLLLAGVAIGATGGGPAGDVNVKSITPGVVMTMTWTGGKVPVAPGVNTQWTTTTNGANLPVYDAAVAAALATPTVIDGTGAGKTVNWSGTNAGSPSSNAGFVVGPAYNFYPYTNFTVSDTGAWQDLAFFKSCTCVVTLDTTYGSGASVYITMSSTNTGTSTPNNSFHGIQAGSVILSSGIYPFDGTARFLKVRIGANASATLSVSCIARPW